MLYVFYVFCLTLSNMSISVCSICTRHLNNIRSKLPWPFMLVYYQTPRENLLINSFMMEVLSYRNQSIGLFCKSINWFLYYRDLRHEGVKLKLSIKLYTWIIKLSKTASATYRVHFVEVIKIWRQRKLLNANKICKQSLFSSQCFINFRLTQIS